LARVGGHSIGVTADREKTVPGRILLDVSGKYSQFFRDNGAVALVVRPDYYIFGAVPEFSELPALVDDLTSRISLVDVSTGRNDTEPLSAH
jgi:hypothetical protein